MPPKKRGAAAADAKKLSKKQPESTRNERAMALMAELNQKMKGRAELVVASKLPMTYITKRLPSGLLTLDLELRGGFPACGLSQIVGPKNSGKTYLYWQVIRQLQSILGDDMMVLLAMTEMRADRTQARLAGVRVALAEEDIAALNESRIQNGWPEFNEVELADMRKDVGNIHELHAQSGELLFDGILDAVEQNIYHLIVVDSIGSIMSEAEAQAESLMDKTYGGAAKSITEWLRKLTALLTMQDKQGRTRDTCVIVINQIRDNIGDPNKEWRTTGGRALEHAKFVDLLVRSGKMLGDHVPVYGPSGTSQQFMPWGKEVNWQIEKGKAGIHEGGKGKFVFDHRIGGVDFALDTLVAGVRHNIVQSAGAWLGIPDPDNEGEYLVRSNGKDAFCAMLRADAIATEAYNALPVARKGEDPVPGVTRGEVQEESWMNYIRTECYRVNAIDIHYNWSK